MNTSSNKRIAKNTLFLYLRLLISMIISLYSARVVLDVLGVVDFGIYNVTGSIIQMFSFLSSTMATATQRYLSFELGKGNEAGVKKVFTQSLYSYLIVLAAVVVVGETVGLWLLNNVLVIPPDRMYSANIVYQFAILTFFFSVMHAPLNASIIAMERMAVFAYGSILYSFLTLVSVIILDNYRSTDSLILYSIFILFCNVIVTVFYYGYCTRNFSFCRIRFSGYDKKIVKEMTSFAFWNVIGTITNLLRNHGVNMLLNVFFSPAINSARAIAIKISTTLSQFSSNFYMAVRPQLVKLYSTDQYQKMTGLAMDSSRFAFLLLSILILPIYCEIDGVLSLWLTKVPDYTSLFARIILITAMIEVLMVPLDHSMQATGKLKKIQLSVCSINILNIPISFVLLKMGFGPEYTMLVNLILICISLFPRLYFIKSTLSLSYSDYFRNVILRLLPSILIFAAWVMFNKNISFMSGINIFILLIIHFLFVFCVAAFVGTSKSEKYMIVQLCKDKFKKL